MSDYEMSDVFVSAIDDGQKFLNSPAGQLHTLASTLPDSDPVKEIVQEHISPAKSITTYARQAPMTEAIKSSVEGNSLVELSTGSGARFSVHSSHGEKFKGFLSELESLGYRIDPRQSGGYNYRKIAGSERWSTHAFGTAIDINWHQNTRQKGVTDLPDNVGEIAKKYGLSWGGTWTNPDYMHFEVSGSNKGTPTHLGVANRVKTDGTVPDTPQYNAYPGLPYQRMAEVPKDADGSIKKTPGVLDATVEFLGSFQNTMKAVGGGTKPSQRSDYKLGDYTA